MAQNHDQLPNSSIEVAYPAEDTTIRGILDDLAGKTKPTIAGPDAGTQLVSPDPTSTTEVTAALWVSDSIRQLHGALGFIRIEEKSDESVVEAFEVTGKIEDYGTTKHIFTNHISLFYPVVTPDGLYILKNQVVVDQDDNFIPRQSGSSVDEKIVMEGLRKNLELESELAPVLRDPRGNPIASEYEAQELAERLSLFVPA